MSTQRQNSLSNISPPQFPSCPQLFALPPTLRRKERKDNLYPNGKLVSGTDFIRSNIPFCFLTCLLLLMFLPNTTCKHTHLPANCFFFPRRLLKAILLGRIGQLFLKNAPSPSPLPCVLPVSVCTYIIQVEWRMKLQIISAPTQFSIQISLEVQRVSVSISSAVILCSLTRLVIHWFS